MKRLALILAITPVAAQADVVTPQGRTIDCYCTNTSGARVELGETICLHVNGRMFMAQCQMSLNVPIWRETQEGCTTSRLDLDAVPFGANTVEQPVQSLAVDTHI